MLSIGLCSILLLCILSNLTSAVHPILDVHSLFDINQFTLGTPLQRIHHRHLSPRATLDDLFSPTSEIHLDYAHNNSQIQTWTFSNVNASYVNLEPLGTHGLLEDSVSLCTSPHAENKSILHVVFRDERSFRLAKGQWEDREGLLFVVDDESCVVEEGEPGIYRADKIFFHDEAEQRFAVRIQAEYKGFGPLPFGTDIASTVTMTGGSLRKFREQHSDSFYLVPRLRERGFWDWAHRKLDDARDWWHRIEDAAEFDIDKTFSMDLNMNPSRKHRHVPLESLQNMGILPKISFIDTYGKGSIDVSFGISFDLLHGAMDMFSNGVAETWIKMEVVEDIDMGLQAEIDVAAGYEYFCAWWLVPEPAFAGCVHVVVLDGIPSIAKPFPLTFGEENFQKAQQGSWKSTNSAAWQKFGMKTLISNGLGIWTKVGTRADVNFTTPGIDVHIPRGAVAEYRYKDGRQMHKKDVQASVKMRAPEIHVNDGTIYASVAFGPRTTLHLGVPGHENRWAFNMEARWDLPELKLVAGQTRGVDENCEKPGDMTEANGFWLDLSVGFYANLVLPFVGTIVDTNWAGKLFGSDWNGLMYNNRLWGMCWKEGKGGMKWMEKKLNEKFRTITAVVNEGSA